MMAERVTGENLYEWLAHMMKADSNEVELSKLEPEQVIEKYFTALDNKEAETATYCVSKRHLLNNLTANISDGALFNEVVGLPLTDGYTGAKSSFDNLKSAKFIKAELVDSDDKIIKMKIFKVTVNLQYKEEVTVGNGEQFRVCFMVRETPQSGWKIEGFGH